MLDDDASVMINVAGRGIPEKAIYISLYDKKNVYGSQDGYQAEKKTHQAGIPDLLLHRYRFNAPVKPFIELFLYADRGLRFLSEKNTDDHGYYEENENYLVIIHGYPPGL